MSRLDRALVVVSCALLFAVLMLALAGCGSAHDDGVVYVPAPVVVVHHRTCHTVTSTQRVYLGKGRWSSRTSTRTVCS